MNRQQHFINLFFGMGLNVILGVITTPIITRLVNPDDYGSLSLFLLFGNIFMLVVLLGREQAYVRFFYHLDELEYKQYLVRITSRVPFLISAAVTVLILAIYFIYDREYLILPIFCIYIISLVVGYFTNLTLRLKLKTGLYAILINIQKLLYVGLVILAVCFTDSDHFIALAVSTVIAQMIIVVLGIVFERDIWKGYYHRIPINPEYLKTVSEKEIALYGFPFVFAGLCNWIFTGADKIMINMFSNSTELGIYASAVSVVGIFSIITTTFNTIWGPMAVEEYEKGNEGKDFFIKANDYVCVILFLAGAGVVLFKDVIVYLLGEDYRAAVFLIPFLTLHPIMYTISESTVYGINFAKKTKYHLITSLVCSLINIVMNYFMIRYMGSLGAAISTGITYTAFFVLRTVFSVRCYKVQYNIKKFTLITFLYYVFVCYNSFNTIDLVSVSIFLVFIAILAYLYKKRIVELGAMVLEYIRRVN